MENIIRTNVTSRMDTIEPAEGYLLVHMIEGEMFETADKIYVKAGTTPDNYQTMTASELKNLENRINYAWEQYIGKEVEEGTKVYYDGKIYEVRQNHTPMVIWTPDLVPALYKLASLSEGTEDDPIEWESGMTCYEGKYYVQSDTLYLGIRDSINPLYYDIAELVGNYFSVASEGGSEAEEGTLENPITWTVGSICYNGKYYTYGGKTYLCTRDSGNALHYEPSVLLGLYFQEV